MSDAGDILTAITADITAAISGVTTSVEPVAIDATVPREDLPFAATWGSGDEAEPLDWGQENRVWDFSSFVIQQGGTRETMQTKLEAIRAQVVADPTLDGTVDKAVFSGALLESPPDSSRIAGVFAIRAEKVA
jgi:hypothetical protein